MPIETFRDLESLREDESPKYATLEALYALYYGAEATSPASVERLTEELRDKLGRATRPPTEDDIELVLGVLATEIDDNHGGVPGNFAADFLLRSGWLSAEVLSDATDLFHEKWLDDKTGYYYDAEGNWYDSDGNSLTPADEQSTAMSEATPADVAAGDPVSAARNDLWSRIPELARETGLSEEELRLEFSKLTLSEIEDALGA